MTLGDTIMKGDATKIRRLSSGKVLCGFAGASADGVRAGRAIRSQAEGLPGQHAACGNGIGQGMANRPPLRRLEALLAVADGEHTLIISGTGDVIQPADGIAGIGSGGNYAIAAARALKKHTQMNASEIVREALAIAAEIDIYTNDQIVVEELE